MNRRFVILIITFLLAQIISCQSPKINQKIVYLDSFNRNRVKPINLIDNPTANTISTEDKEFQVNLRRDLQNNCSLELPMEDRISLVTEVLNGTNHPG